MEGMPERAFYPNYGTPIQGAMKVETLTGKRQLSEMEQLSANLADTARRLSDLADKFQGRLDFFLQSDQTTLGEDPAVVPAPQPGSLAAIKLFHRRIDEAASRLDSQLMTLASLL